MSNPPRRTAKAPSIENFFATVLGATIKLKHFPVYRFATLTIQGHGECYWFGVRYYGSDECPGTVECA